MSALILFHLALAAYTASAAAYLTWLVQPRDGTARVGIVSMLAGFLIHGVALAVGTAAAGPDTTFKLAEGLSILAFLAVGQYLLVSRFYKLPVIGAFVAPLVVAVLVPAHVIPLERTRDPIAGVVLPVHVAVSLGGVALFAVGFGVALMYVLLEREVKAKRLGAMFRRLPSLDLLDRLNYRLVVFGFVLLSAAIGTGALFAKQETGGMPFGPKQIFSLSAWGLLAIVVLLRQTTGWRGRKVALATMGSFALMILTYVGMFARGPA